MQGLASDREGNLLVVGGTTSPDLPATGFQKTLIGNSSGGFVAKFSATGKPLWATYLSGVHGGKALAVDAAGDIYVVTGSQIVKIASDGQRLMWTSPLDVYQNALAVDPAGLVWVVGWKSLGRLAFWYLIQLDAGTGKEIKREQQTYFNSDIATDASGQLWLATSGGIAKISQGKTTLFQDPFSTGANPQTIGVNGDLVCGLAPFGIPRNGTRGRVGCLSAASGETLWVAEYTPNTGNGAGLPLPSIALDAGGRLWVAGWAERQLKTRSLLQGAFNDYTGFVGSLEGGELAFSSFVGDDRPFSVAGIVAKSGGRGVFAGSTGTGLAQGRPGGVFLVELIPEPAPAVRVDSILLDGETRSLPLQPARLVILSGAGFGADTEVLLDGLRLAVLSQSDTEVRFATPTDLEAGAPVKIRVRSGDVLSNEVVMPTQ